jgi:16S rRNA (cytosine967-C5)-methyltransferase
LNARQAALDILSGVLKNKSSLNLELKRALRGSMSAEDRRFAAALASTAIENLYRIDYALKQFVTAGRVHTVIRNILRLGACQLLFFESVPESAAVNESVKLARQAGKGRLTGFVNAALRNMAANLGGVRWPGRADLAEYLHIMYSYPKWLCEKYIREYGGRQAEDMVSYRGDPSLTCVRRNGPAALPEEWERGRYCEDARYIRNVGDIARMPQFVRGEIAVQGEASMICVRAAGIRPGDAVLDACAAPGGKSCYAARFAARGSVTALELHEHRVRLIEATAARLGVSNLRAVAADAAVPMPEYREAFDVALVDAPCSALGLLYRKPDVKLFREEGDLPRLAALQRRILDCCAEYVRPGGVLLYATCTVDRMENDDVVDAFLEAHGDFSGDDLKNETPAGLADRARRGRIQLFPHMDGIDGFFIARMRKHG